MKIYLISSSATVIGRFQGETPAHAIVAMHRDAGLRSAVGADGTVCHDSRDVESGAVRPSETAELTVTRVPALDISALSWDGVRHAGHGTDEERDELATQCSDVAEAVLDGWCHGDVDTDADADEGEDAGLFGEIVFDAVCSHPNDTKAARRMVEEHFARVMP